MSCGGSKHDNRNAAAISDAVAWSGGASTWQDGERAFHEVTAEQATRLRGEFTALHGRKPNRAEGKDITQQAQAVARSRLMQVMADRAAVGKAATGTATTGAAVVEDDWPSFDAPVREQGGAAVGGVPLPRMEDSWPGARGGHGAPVRRPMSASLADANPYALADRLQAEGEADAEAFGAWCEEHDVDEGDESAMEQARVRFAEESNEARQAYWEGVAEDRAAGGDWY